MGYRLSIIRNNELYELTPQQINKSTNQQTNKSTPQHLHSHVMKRTHNIYVFLLLKFVLALGVIWATQIVFALSHTRIFEVAGFSEWMGIIWGNIRFGIASVAAFTLPYLLLMLLPLSCRWKRWYRTICETLYLGAMVLAIFVNISDAIYYQFTYRRLSSEILGYLTIGGDMGTLWPKFLTDYWYASLSGVVIIALFIWLSFRIKLAPRNTHNKHFANDITGFIVGGLLVFVMLRGGFGRTIQPSDAARYCQLRNTALVNNSLYNIVRTVLIPDIEEQTFMSDAEALLQFNPQKQPFAAWYNAQQTDSTGLCIDWDWNYGYWHPGAGEIIPPPPLPGEEGATVPIRHKNVVIIMLESFSQEYMGCYNNGIMESYTPFLDSLAAHSFVYDGRSNGKKSIEAIPAVLASIPSLSEKAFIMSDFFDNDFDALPAILHRHGYHTAFFHGSYNGSMKFDLFCKKAGIENYYGKTEYKNEVAYNETDFDNVWGVYDEPFLQYMVQKINTFKEPFFSGVFTISSHHPYNIPPQHKGKFKQGEHKLLECIMYSDYALQQFFKSAAQQPWFRNTLFVILADHPGQGLHPEYNGYDGWYHIPMIFFDPESDRSLRSNKIVQQLDIMPTIIDYLGFDDPIVSFGQSALWNQHENMGFQIAYGNGFHQLVRKQSDGTTSVAAIQKGTEIGNSDDIQLLKAILQQYNHRLLTNRLLANEK